MAVRIKKRVGKSLRRISLFGKPFKVPRVKEKVSGAFVVDKLFSAHLVKKNSSHVSYERTYRVARTHLPDDISNEFLVIDPIGLIPQAGMHTLSIRELGDKAREDFLKRVTSAWLNPERGEKSTMTRLYMAEPTVDPRKFFSELQEEWKRVLECLVTEGLEKDVRLMDGFKASLLPFYGSPEMWQSHNPHQIWLTNTGTGKSMFNLIAGNASNIDLSTAGLFGANVDDYKKQRTGVLAGTGMIMFDEMEQLANVEYSKQVVLHLLGYLEQGVVDRRLKVPIRCKGTKTVIFSSNPTSDDMLESFVTIHTLLQGQGDPTRLGRRIGLFLMGNDFKRINPETAISTLRDPIRRLLQIACLQYKARYVKLIMRNKAWVDDPKKEYIDYQNTVRAMADGCPDDLTKKFIEGLSYTSNRLRMASVRIALLENLDEFVLGRGITSIQRKLVENRETVYERLCNANFKSIENLVVTDSEKGETAECARKIKAKFPSLSARSIAKIMDKHHGTVARWLKEDG